MVVLAVAAIFAIEAFAYAVANVGVANLGYDYFAYINAAHRILDGAPLYDVSVNVAGGFAIYLYPPMFALAFLAVGLMPDALALWQWEAVAVGSIVAGVAILPVKPRVRWIMLILCVINWPVLTSILIGQVGPLLFLLFAIGWRWRDRPVVLAVTMAAGAMIKVQPVILLGWAALTGRWRAVAVALGVMAVAAVISTVFFGPAVWSDYFSLLGRVNGSVATPNGFSPGALAFHAGVSEGAAQLIQFATMVVVGGIVLVSILKASDEVSYLTTVVASQVVSPVVWDHYAVVLVLPVAWLLERGQWWAVGLMLVTSIPVILFLPMAIYPFLFLIGMVAPIVVDVAERRRASAARPRAAVEPA
jgi:hypothetical protein